MLCVLLYVYIRTVIEAVNRRGEREKKNVFDMHGKTGGCVYSRRERERERERERKKSVKKACKLHIVERRRGEQVENAIIKKIVSPFMIFHRRTRTTR